MNDLRIELRARNNILWHAIFDNYKSVSEFCRQYDLHQVEVGKLLNLTMSPYHLRVRGGGKNSTAIKLSEVLNFEFNELFPVDLYRRVINPRIVIEGDSARLMTLTDAVKSRLLPNFQPDPTDAIFNEELRARLLEALKTLTPREAKVLVWRYGFTDEGALTYADISDRFAVSIERIRQIEAKALRKLRDPSRSRPLRAFAGLPKQIEAPNGDVSEIPNAAPVVQQPEWKPLSDDAINKLAQQFQDMPAEQIRAVFNRGINDIGD